MRSPARAAPLPSRLAITLRASTLLAALALLASPIHARAREVVAPWAATVAFEGGYTDNVQWTGDTTKQDDAFFETIEGRFDWENTRWRYAPDQAQVGVRGRIFNGFSERDYAEVYSEGTYDVGRTTSVSLRYDYISNQIQVDQDASGDTVYAMSHELTFGAEHKFGQTKKFRMRAELDADWDDSQSSSNARDSFTPTGAVYARYILHDLLMPRFGVSYGVRNAKSSNYSRDEVGLEAGSDSRLLENLVLGLRYRWLMRDYTVGSPTTSTGSSNSNYHREDHANQLDARLEYGVPGIEGLAVIARVRLRDNQSNHNEHDFNVHEGGLGVSYTYR